MLYFFAVVCYYFNCRVPAWSAGKSGILVSAALLIFFNFFHTRPRPCLANGVYYPPLPASYKPEAALLDGSSVCSLLFSANNIIARFVRSKVQSLCKVVTTVPFPLQCSSVSDDASCTTSCAICRVAGRCHSRSISCPSTSVAQICVGRRRVWTILGR